MNNTSSRAQSNPRKLFIDCGAHDGCSVVKFLLARPDFVCYSFEPNPTLWGHFRYLPTELVQSAVLDRNGSVQFTIDPIDGDGSTLILQKRVDATLNLSNAECPTISVECINLAEWIFKNTLCSDLVALKLDIEGAEYAVLQHLIDTRAISRISELYVEFHHERCGISVGQHQGLLEALNQYLSPKEWDASDYSVFRQPVYRRAFRFMHLARIFFKRLFIWIVRKYKH